MARWLALLWRIVGAAPLLVELMRSAFDKLIDLARSRRGAVSGWLLLALAASIALVVATFLLFASDRFEPEAPVTVFTDVTRESGIEFVHNNGAAGENLLPETMGSGAAFFDFDNDGGQDLLLVNSTYWPWEETEGRTPTTVALYRNDGRGNFEDVTVELGLDKSIYGMGVAVGDYDNDGWVDLFLTAVGRNYLFKNVEGERFEEVSVASGVGGADNEWSTSAAWVDLDNDGLLDLFVCNYVRWARELGIELAFKLAGIGHGYGPQVNFTGTVPYLYLNNGDGSFREVARRRGFELIDETTGYPLARSLAVAPIDLDADGWMDLVVANHRMENFVFRNLGDASFAEVGDLAWEEDSLNGGALGIDAARVSDANLLDASVGSFANELSQVYRNVGDSVLLASEALADEADAARAFQRFGMFFFDYDLDGRLDLLAVNGYLEEEINRIDPEVEFRRSSQLFWNRGPRAERRFAEVGAPKVGDDLFQPVVGRGAAFADIDGNGTLDVLVTQNGGPPLLLKNEADIRNNWLRIKLVGTRSNRDAIGAKIEVLVGNRTLMNRVMPTRSYLSQSELPVTIGLGRAWKTRSVRVIWPDGSSQTVEDVELNRELRVVQR